MKIKKSFDFQNLFARSPCSAFKVIVVVLLLASAPLSQRQNTKLEAHEGVCSFFPPNNLRFPILASGQMSQLDFNRILQVAQQTYAPIFWQMGLGRFQILPRWEDNTVNANAFVHDFETSPGVQTPTRFVQIFGGLARHPLMTREALLLTVCHEIGHHLGGYPKYDQGHNWASTEGQSDYFSTAKCTRLIFRQLTSNAAWLEHAQVDFQVRTQCQASFPDSPLEATMCMRSAMGGLSLARVLGSLNSAPTQVDFLHRDLSSVSETFEGHPNAQCRLDTYFQGAICRASEFTAFGSAPGQGDCHSRENLRGSRPTCWYHDPRGN